MIVQRAKSYSARLLNQTLNDNTNYLYLKIFKPILVEVQRVNLLFQKDDVELCRTYDNLSDFVILFANKVLIKSFRDKKILTVLQAFDYELPYKPVSQVDFGIEYTQALQAYPITPEQKTEIEDRAFSYKRLCVEFAERIPTNLKQFQGLNILLPRVSLNQVQRPAFKDLPFIEKLGKADELVTMEIQWNQLPLVDWKSSCIGSIPKRSAEFWPKVFAFQDAGGDFVFKELAGYVFKILTLSTSNAVIERVFSTINTVKTKARNRMSILLLDAILRIRIIFHVKKNSYRVVYPFKNNNDQEKDDKEENTLFESLQDIELPCIHLLDPDV